MKLPYAGSVACYPLLRSPDCAHRGTDRVGVAGQSALTSRTVHVDYGQSMRTDCRPSKVCERNGDDLQLAAFKCKNHDREHVPWMTGKQSRR